jgi:hypothetical protein
MDLCCVFQTCPHRYSRQEPCSVISVDVKNHSNLQDSLAEYTKVGGSLADPDPLKPDPESTSKTKAGSGSVSK